MITLQVGNLFVDVHGDIPSSVYSKLERTLSFRPNGFQFHPLYNRFIEKDGKKIRRIWDGWKHQCWKNKKRTYFPTGLYSLAVDCLKQENITFQTIDYREKPERNLNITLNENISLRPYQDNAVSTSCLKTRGIIQAATGGGKTIMAAGIIARLGVVPFVFFVTSTDLLTQAKEDLEEALQVNGVPLKVGQIGGGIIDIKDVNVITAQTAIRAIGKKWDKEHKFDSEDRDDLTPIEKYREEIQHLLRSAKGVMCDEVQHWRAQTCQEIARELKSAYYTYGLSATPYRDEGDDLAIQACFGKKCVEITASELIKQNWLIKPEIKIVHIRNKPTLFKNWSSIYKSEVVENEFYNGIIANIANAYIKHDRLVLVLAQHISHIEKLGRMIPGSLVLSGDSPKIKRKNGLDKLRNRQISCIVSSSIFDEGIDVRPLDTVLLAGQGMSKVRAMQRIGRITRPYEDKTRKKTRATAIDFCIHQKYLIDHAKAREKMYRTEEEYSIEHIEV